MTERPSGQPSDAGTWLAVQSGAQFRELRRRLRRFVFPMTALFLAWYLLYVLLADYAHEFMSTRVVGNVNVGLVLGLLQFVSTFAITMLYVRHAGRRLDPLAAEIRERVEAGGEPAPPPGSTQPGSTQPGPTQPGPTQPRPTDGGATR
nr:DUF485 domain-containing protein [Streptoalloteichus hindustanus]